MTNDMMTLQALLEKSSDSVVAEGGLKFAYPQSKLFNS